MPRLEFHILKKSLKLKCAHNYSHTLLPMAEVFSQGGWRCRPRQTGGANKPNLPGTGGDAARAWLLTDWSCSAFELGSARAHAPPVEGIWNKNWGGKSQRRSP